MTFCGRDPPSRNYTQQTMKKTKLLRYWTRGLRAAALALVFATLAVPDSLAQAKKTNIVAIMADDIGWFNLSCYHGGIMASRTPNLDRLAAKGMRFTDYYAEASCTAGRANFIT